MHWIRRARYDKLGRKWQNAWHCSLQHYGLYLLFHVAVCGGSFGRYFWSYWVQLNILSLRARYVKSGRNWWSAWYQFHYGASLLHRTVCSGYFRYCEIDQTWNILDIKLFFLGIAIINATQLTSRLQTLHLTQHTRRGIVAYGGSLIFDLWRSTTSMLLAWYGRQRRN